MKTIIRPGAFSWLCTCKRCCTEFTYALPDLVEHKLLFMSLGFYVQCPKCSFDNPAGEPDGGWPHGRRAASLGDSPPSYYELLRELKRVTGYAESANEILADREDEEDVRDAQLVVREARELIARAEPRS